MADNTVEIRLALNAARLIDGARQGKRAFSAALSGIETDAKRASSVIDQSFKTLGLRSQREIQREIAKTRVAYRLLAVSGKATGADLQRAASATSERLRRLHAELRGIRQTDVSGTFGDLARKTLVWGSALLSVNAAIGLVREGTRSVLETGGDFEQLAVRLNKVMGSVAAGRQAFAWIQQFTAKTPLQLQQVTEQFVQLRNFGLDPMDGTLRKLTDTAAQLGNAQERLPRIALAVGQAWVKQKLQGEEILQLVEAGVPVWDLLSKAMGKNVAELQAMSQKGELGRDVMRKLIDEMGRMADGAAQAQMATWTGLVSNARDVVSVFLNTIATSGALDYFKAELSNVLAEVQSLSQSGELQKWARDVSGDIVTVASTLRELLSLLIEYRHQLALAGEVAVAAFGARFISRLSDAAKASGALGETAVGVAGFARAWRLLRAATGVGIAVIAVQEGLKLFGLFAENAQRARQSALAVAALQRQIESATSAVRHMEVLSKDQLQQLTADELDSYRKRLQAALDFSRSRLELESRQDYASAAARDAAREVQIRSQALRQLLPILRNRADTERTFADRVASIKKDETDRIRTQLAEQVAAYEKANKDLEAAQKNRKAIEDEFKAFVERIRSGNAANKPADFVDIANQKLQAQQAVAAGDFKKAIDLSRKAAAALEDLQKSGDSNTLALTGMAEQIQRVANQAAAAQEAQAKKAADAAKVQIKSLVEQAAALKQIEVGFDADASSAKLKKQILSLRDQLAKALTIPVTLVQPDKTKTAAQKTADTLIKDLPARASGGLIFGPGTETSDSILARLSRNEFVLRAAAVRHYGLGFIERLNRLQLPRFATGGLVAPSVPRIAAPLISPASGVPVNLHLPGGDVVALSGTTDQVAGLRRAIGRQALKTGRRM